MVKQIHNEEPVGCFVVLFCVFFLVRHVADALQHPLVYLEAAPGVGHSNMKAPG